MHTTNYHDKEIVLVQILYLYVIPTLLLYYRVIPEGFHVLVLFSVSLFMYGIIKRAHWSYDDLEIRKNFLKDVVPYAIFTAVGVGLLVAVSYMLPKAPVRPGYEWWEDVRFLLLFIPISVLQEVVFRGILMRLLRRAFSSAIFIILLNASLFTLIHIIYINADIILPLTFIGGVGFAWIYYRHPNLPLVSLSHIILNFTAMILGFFIAR